MWNAVSTVSGKTDNACEQNYRDESTPGCRWHGTAWAARQRWGHCRKVLYGSVATRQVWHTCFLFVLSLKWCGATRQKIVWKREQMHWAVRGRAMTRHRGARDTPSRLLYHPPWLRGPPFFPFTGQLWNSGLFFSKWWCPWPCPQEELLIVQIRAGLGTRWVMVKSSEAIAAVSCSLGEAEIIKISYSTLLSQAKLCLDLKTFHWWWNPLASVGPAAQGW